MPTFRIVLRPGGQELSCAEDEPILTALLRHGFRVVYGCRGGGSGACKMLLASGSVDHRKCSKAVLTDEERAHGHFLCCQAVPETDIEIEIQEINRLEKLRWFGGHLDG